MKHKVICFLLINCVCASVYAVEIDLDRIIQIESSGKAKAHRTIGNENARGLFQITPICLTEWNNYHPKEKYTPDELFNPKISRRIGVWYLNKRIPQMLKYYGKPVTLRNILVSYNAGVDYVVTGKKIPSKTQAYLKKYGRLGTYGDKKGSKAGDIGRRTEAKTREARKDL